VAYQQEFLQLNENTKDWVKKPGICIRQQGAHLTRSGTEWVTNRVNFVENKPGRLV